jgi:hypothetical protein
MADINIERKRRSLWPWLLSLLIIAAIAAAVWWYMEGRQASGGPGALGTDTSAAAAMPAYDPATAPPYPADQAAATQPGDTTPR